MQLRPAASKLSPSLLLFIRDWYKIVNILQDSVRLWHVGIYFQRRVFLLCKLQRVQTRTSSVCFLLPHFLWLICIITSIALSRSSRWDFNYHSSVAPLSPDLIPDSLNQFCSYTLNHKFSTFFQIPPKVEKVWTQVLVQNCWIKLGASNQVV